MVENENNLELVVPKQAKRRNEIRNAAAVLVQSEKLLPPVSFEILEQLGRDVVASVNGSSDELAFAIVVCGNELWRKYVEATPFNRRLLLMPQCLKKTSSCKAIVDDLGLICAGCNSCSMNDILAEAESLGYSTLIAEGTTVAVALVEEGAIDAVIGVGCLAVLQKSFQHLGDSAVPAIAIPLIADGCVDSEVDTIWLLKELQTVTSNVNFESLSVSQLKEQVRNFFSEQNLARKLFSSNIPTQTERLATEAFLNGGQRTRPLLTLLAYTAYSENFDSEIAEQLMLMVECFHKSSLIHDDIEDLDDFRYQHKTAHKQHGVPIAINLGDYLIGKGYQILAELNIDITHKMRLFQLITNLHVESAIGQGEELLSVLGEKIFNVESTEKIFEQKTGSAIKVSLLAGAIAADAPESDLQILDNFSAKFGIAYQIRDDLNEFRGDATDQQSASFPYLKSILVERCQVLTVDAESIKMLIVKNEIDKITYETLVQKINEMKRLLNQLSSNKLRLALLNVINKLFEAK